MSTGKGNMNVQLQQTERDLIERVTSLFPPGVINPSRVARLAIQAGIGKVEADMRAAAERFAASGLEPKP
jgi:hypothetical protein